ncbi:enoyl-CoA hydratase [Bacillus solimangrovi]|uniref:Ethylmalonyl-CoA decarboxylase n=2 Tax=Bacillus solimangrovi TaxID=1305675 RepID=A0A1E5LIP6_9BACI|nr:enoyl-CoA hydratase [Bacillus solimangrovi]
MIELDDRGVLVLTINREEKWNAVDYDVILAFQDALEQAERDERVKLMSITGAGGKAFCSGGDLSVFHELFSKEDAFGMLSKMGDVLHKLFILPKPTVALVNGTALGGGCEILTACDFRLAKENITFGFVQGKLAITTGWGGGTMLFERLKKQDAMKLLMTAERYSASDGKCLQLFQEVFPKVSFFDDSSSWIDKLVAQDVAVLRAYKEMMLQRVDVGKLRKNMFLEIERCSLLWESEAHHKAVQAFLKK